MILTEKVETCSLANFEAYSLVRFSQKRLHFFSGLHRSSLLLKCVTEHIFMKCNLGAATLK